VGEACDPPALYREGFAECRAGTCEARDGDAVQATVCGP